MSLQYIIAHTKVKGPIIGQNYFPLESVPDPGKCFSSSLQFCYSSTRVERVNRRRRRKKKKKKKRERHLTWEPQNGSFSRARSIRAIYFKICLGKRREEMAEWTAKMSKRQQSRFDPRWQQKLFGSKRKREKLNRAQNKSLPRTKRNILFYIRSFSKLGSPVVRPTNGALEPSSDWLQMLPGPLACVCIRVYSKVFF